MARARGWDEIVVKPSISGGGYRTYRFRVEDAADHAAEIDATLADRGVLIQPFLPEIHDGELSLLFFDGGFSHAIRKGPLLKRGEDSTTGLYAEETTEPRAPSPD